MGETFQKRISALLLSNRRHARYVAMVMCMAVAVVFGVAVGLTQKGQAKTHEETVLDCQYSGNGAHTHVAECYDADGNLVCPLEEKQLHKHDDSCWATKTQLVCGLEEGEGAHTHTDDCWATDTHLACGLEEGEGAHTHTDECYDEDGNLVCGLEESEGHVHTDDCWETDTYLNCGQEESEGHVHTDDCWETDTFLDCGLEEVTEEHVHGEGCFKTIVVNDDDETPAATAGSDAPAMPAQTIKGELKEIDEDGNEKVVLTVTAKAPAGAFPEGTTMKVEPVSPNTIEKTIDEAVAKKTDDKVVEIQSIDLTFEDKDGKKVEPAKQITVTLASELIARALEDDPTVRDEKPLLVYIDEHGEGKVIHTLSVTELEQRKITAEDNETLFDSSKFGTYGIVITEPQPEAEDETLVVQGDTLVAEGSTYKVYVNYGEEAGIPEGSTLEVAEIEEGNDAYADLNEQVMGAVDPELLKFVELLDLSIVNEGEKVTLEAPVDVTIELSGLDKADDVSAFVSQNEDLVKLATADENNKLEYETTDLTATAIVGTDYSENKTITATAEDGAVVTIQGKLPEGAVASITPVKLTKDELVAYYGKDLIDAIDNMVVYDICILVDGEEWEPDDSVSVVIQSPAIETKESNEEIAVTHLQEEEDKRTVEMVETEVTAEGDVAFKTDSFSLYGLYTYTVDYYLNDNEYHQPGNTSMMLSELFEHLLVDIPVSEVANVEFSDYSLLQIDREGEDFKITSLKPFTSDELMTVHFKDGSFLTIITKDILYANYTYQSSDLTPYTGSFNYVGHYNIFGGGNGVPSVVTELPDNWWAGNYGGNSYWETTAHPSDGGVTVTLPSLKGKAIGNDQNGDPLVAEPGKFKSGSSADITWSGNLEKAFMSFSWLYYYGTASNKTHAIFDVKLYAPNGEYTTVVLNTDSQTNDPRDPETEETTSAWRILSFEATNFVRAHGQGTYTMVVTVEPTPGHTTIGSYLSDMGFTIYGVTADSSRPMSAIAGVVDEIMISQDSSGLPNMSANVSFAEPITPRGNGKAWFNCQGGEYIAVTSGTEHDRDYLEAKTVDGRYLKFGEGGDIPVTGWNAEDITCPNHNQTNPDGLVGYSNRCSFGLGSFSGLQGIGEIVGLRKKMAQGNDCFGSMMLLIEIMPAEGTVEVTKKLEYDGNGVNDRLPEAGSQRVLTFHVEPVDGAPVPFKVEGGVEVPNQDFEVTFDPGSQTGTEILLEMGKFRFRGEDIPDSATGSGPWYFTYDVTETRTGSIEPWTYDTRTLQLTFKVVVDEVNSGFKIESYEWSVKDHPEDEDNFFKNRYELPVELAVQKIDEDEQPVAGATFVLYKDQGCTELAEGIFTDEAREHALTADGVTTATPDCVAHFYGIDKDNAPYYLKEISVLEPYIQDERVVTIDYDANADSWSYQFAGEDKKPLTATVSDTIDLGTLSMRFVNERGYDVYVQKTDDQTPANRIAGSWFQLFKLNTENNEYEPYGDQFEVSKTGDGYKFVKLNPGSYRLDEVQSPEGYLITTTSTFFVVNGKTTNGVITLTPGQEQQNASLKQTVLKDDTISIKNIPGQALPRTGGPGTTLFTITGSAMCLAAVVMYGFTSRRGRERRFD